ncbi:MAG TPA: HrpB1 family type III secretion system apparatus protein [Ramlibacter sp.]|nr:HrpB1 family type III secretion system apparatus protein [Ramlibacter sp.]
MDPKLDSKELFRALVDVLDYGLYHDLVEDAERVLAALRAMRPRMLELDTFEAVIAMKRNNWEDAMRMLRGVDTNSTAPNVAKALIACCQMATGDSSWSETANHIVRSGGNPDAIRLMQLMLDPESVLKASPQAAADKPEEDAAVVPAAAAREMQGGNFLRA